MNDIFGKLYNGFLLRDLLGYVIPGSVVLFCFMHLASLIEQISIAEVLDLIPEGGLSNFLIVCTCYVCGHFLSGVFFHTPIFSWLFKYSPNLEKAYPNLTKSRAWAKHRSEYRRACKVIGESMQSHIERHAALIHFTGHISSSLLFLILYLITISLFKRSITPIYYAIVPMILFPGLFSHFRKLAIERYHLEIDAIEFSLKGTSLNNDT